MDLAAVEPRTPPSWEDRAAGTRCHLEGDRVVLVWPTARFAVTPDGVEFSAPRLADAVHPLLTTVWSVVLAGRGREPLHATVVARDGSGLAVMGLPGAGKSTSAWRLIERGWILVSDDVTVLDDESRAMPGMPLLRVRPEGRPTARADEKTHLDTPTSASPVPLAVVVALDEAAPALRRLRPAEAVGALLRNLYNPIDTHDGQPAARFRMLVDLVQRARVYEAPARGVDPGQLEAIMAEAE